MTGQTKCSRCEVVIVATDDDLCRNCRAFPERLAKVRAMLAKTKPTTEDQ